MRPARLVRAAGRARLALVLVVPIATCLGATPLAEAVSNDVLAARAADTSVTLTVESISPSTPTITTANVPLTITVELRNNTSVALPDVEVKAQRGDPIGTQAALDASLADASAHTTGRLITPVGAANTTTLPAQSATRVTFRTTTSTLDNVNSPRVCLCHTAAVYPIDLSAHVTVAGVDHRLGSVRTYLPSFDTPPAKLAVSWVWPLIDRPHRIADGSEFTDDALADSVSGGRLDHSLAVIENVEQQSDIPMTLVVDPELLDELEIMAAGKYTIRPVDSTKAVAGIGQQAAQSWLDRFAALLSGHPDLSVQLTPYADPDVTGLTRHKQSWATTLSGPMAIDVATALAGEPEQHTVAWPPGGAVDRTTLNRLAAAGASTVILDGSTVTPSAVNGAPASFARLNTSTGHVTAALTSSVVERDIASIVARTGSGAALLPQLMSELAIRVAENPNASHAVVLTPSRYVDPSPTAAAQAIIATSRSTFSTPAALQSVASSGVVPTRASSLRRFASGSGNLSRSALDTAVSIHDSVPFVTSLLRQSPSGRLVVEGLPGALQRIESASWSSAAESAQVGGSTLGSQLADGLGSRVDGYLHGVTILNRSSASYTLSSSNSPLPITVRNSLPYVVAITVSVSTVGGVPGFSATTRHDVLVQQSSKVTLKIATRIHLSGRIPVEAVVRTPNGRTLGDPVQLYVHSTVLGTIGVVITITAGVVLVLALLVRYIRRVQRIRRKRGGPESENLSPELVEDRSGARA